MAAYPVFVYVVSRAGRQSTCHNNIIKKKFIFLTRDLTRNYMCSLMMISDMLSKHVEAVKSVLKKRFKINDIQLVHLLVV